MLLEWDGIFVEVTLEGKAGHGVLMLHGWMCSAEMMGGIQHALSGEMRTAAVDFPGHGRHGASPRPRSAWGVPEYMEMTAEVIRALDLAPCDIIAHSFGARVAILLAATYPELVDRMVLTGAAGIRREQTGKESSRQKMYRFLKGGVGVLDRMKIFGGLTDRWREQLIQHYGSEDYKALDPEMRQIFNKIVTQDLTDALPKIQAPTFLFWGTNDTETPLWMGKKMETMIPDAGMYEVEGAGHFAYLEQQRAFEQSVKAFLLKENRT